LRFAALASQREGGRVVHETAVKGRERQRHKTEIKLPLALGNLNRVSCH